MTTIASVLSPIGPVPDDWAVKPLQAVVRPLGRKNVGLAETNLLSLSYGSIVRKDIDALEGLLPESFEGYQIVEADDVVFRFTDLQNDQRSLRSGLAQERGIITSAYLAVRPTSINARYFAYLMRAYDQEKVFYSFGGGVRQSLKFDDVKRLPVPVPAVERQRRIAEFLDRETAQIDELIAKQEQLISTLAEREVALITTVVGRRGPAGTQPRVGSLRRFLKSITDGAHISPETEGGLHDFVSTRDISNGEIDFEGSLKTSPETYEYMVRTGCRPRPGDILFSKDGTVGKTAVVPSGRDFVVASSLVILQPDRSAVESRFLDYVLRSHGVQAQVGLFVKGAGLPRISVANVGRLVVEVPDLGSQSLAVRVLDDSLESLRHLVMRAETAIDLLRERRQALISAAVTGQIDVGGAS